jgi:hypothetical protein
MVVSVNFNKRVPPGAASRGTLAELMAKSQAAADARASAVAPVETPTIMQGLGHVAQVISSGIQEGRAQRSEAEARDALAKIQATVGLEGATPAQLAEIGRYDPQIAQQYREEAVQARRDAAARAEAGLDRNVQTRGQDITATTAGNQLAETSRSNRATEGIQTGQLGETKRSNIATEGIQAATQTETGRHNVAAETTDEATLAANAAHNKATEEVATGQLSETQRANKAAEEAAQADAAAKAAEPQSSLAKLVDDYNAGRLGEKGSEQAKTILNAGLRKETAATKGLQLTVDKDGNISLEQGGVEGGDIIGSKPEVTNQANASQVYIDQAKAANDALPAIDAMEKSLGNLGYTGPGGEIIGSIDDALQGAQSTLGIPKDYQVSLPGDPAARALMDVGGLQQTLQHVQSTKGAVSDAEMGLFRQASAGLGKNPEANAIIIKMARAIINRANERATKAQAYAAANGGRVTGFEQQWNQYINDSPIIGVDKNGMPVVNDGGTQSAQPDTGGEPVKPANIPQSEWDQMTPEDKRLFK